MFRKYLFTKITVNNNNFKKLMVWKDYIVNMSLLHKAIYGFNAISIIPVVFFTELE